MRDGMIKLRKKWNWNVVLMDMYFSEMVEEGED